MKWLILSLWVVAVASAQNIVVDTAPSHVANIFSPVLALGAGHAEPDGPASRSTLAAARPDTLLSATEGLDHRSTR
jgi:hypothetical protein